MKFKDEIFTNYMVRKSKLEKENFRKYVINQFQDSNLDVTIEHGNFNSNNIIIGNLDKAKVIYTAHYDTQAVLPFPNIATPTSLLATILYQGLLVVVMLAVLLGLEFLLIKILGPDSFLAAFIPLIVCLLFLYLMLFGPSNKTTVNDNTSGVITVLNIASRIKDEDKDKVCFVLFDLEEAGLIGSSAFQNKHKKILKDKLIINFDCVSDGDEALFVFNKGSKKYLDDISKSYKGTDKVLSKMVYKGFSFYPSDQLNFRNAIGVCTVIRGKHFEYIDKIHTKKDTVFNEDNLNFLIDSSLEYIKKISI